MSSIIRLIRSLGDSGIDRSFETYYGAIIMKNRDVAPNADEARRDFAAVRATLERAVTF